LLKKGGYVVIGQW